MRQRNLDSCPDCPYNPNMADRTTACVFSTIFTELAVNPTDEHKAIAAKMWPFTRQYDFSPYQMCCDDALITLGLARWTDTEDGPRIVYGAAQ